MLTIEIKAKERWDEVNECFIPMGKDRTIALEHSLVSLSKWESKWHKPFLGKEEKTFEEKIDYVRCMTLTQNVESDLYYCLSPQNWREINEYIDDPATATTFKKTNEGPSRSREIITSELIYYWMIAYNIPTEFQKWHLNRLFTLIRICSIKNAPDKKRSRSDMLAERRALNASRRAKHHTRG